MIRYTKAAWYIKRKKKKTGVCAARGKASPLQARTAAIRGQVRGRTGSPNTKQNGVRAPSGRAARRELETDLLRRGKRKEKKRLVWRGARANESSRAIDQTSSLFCASQHLFKNLTYLFRTQRFCSAAADKRKRGRPSSTSCQCSGTGGLVRVRR